MFTGLIRAIGTVTASRASGAGRRLAVAPEPPLNLAVGDSLAVDGICLTVAARDTAGRPSVDLSPETLERTTAGTWTEGTRVNLEPSLRVGDELGGHLVFGHVDAVATVESRRDNGETSDFWLSCPAALGPALAPKGSVALDGISLTVNEVADGADGVTRFRLTLIPHTLAATTWHARGAGQGCNLELDMLARYVQRQLAHRDG